MEQQLQQLYDILRMLRRRAVPIALISVLGVTCAAFLAFVLPPKYVSTARILVESQQIPDELARSTVTSTAYERLKLIEQRLMARDNLRDLIEKRNLYVERPDLTIFEKIDAVRDATSFQSVSLGPSNPRSGVAISAFTISVTLEDPGKAAAVANELVSAVLQQNLRARSQRARQTLKFFDDERDRLAAEIQALDRELTAFKTSNEVALPESLEFRRAELARLMETGLGLEQRLLALREQRSAIEAGEADGALPRRQLSPEETLLRQLETELAQKRGFLSETHPEIQNLKGRIASLRALVGDGGSTEDGETMSQIERATARQIALLDSQIGLLEDQQRLLERRRTEIGDSLLRTPSVESTLTGLTRRRDELLGQYDAIIRKRSEAETGERLELGQQAERFEVIENALPPEEPVSPNRKKILIMGVGASLAAAFGLAFLIEMLNPALRSSSQMQRRLNLVPLAAIPRVRTRRERFRRHAALAAAFLFLVTAVPSGLWMIDQHIRPIQSIIRSASEKSGLDEMMRMVRTRF